MASEQPLQILKDAVEQGGGRWCGVQTTVDSEEALLQFTTEDGALLNIKFNPNRFYFAAIVVDVKLRLEKHAREIGGRRIAVKASTLERLRQTASDLESEIKDILGGTSGNKTRRKTH